MGEKKSTMEELVPKLRLRVQGPGLVREYSCLSLERVNSEEQGTGGKGRGGKTATAEIEAPNRYSGITCLQSFTCVLYQLCHTQCHPSAEHLV